MIAFLISLAPFIPTILQLVAWIFSWAGASKENLQAYQDMIQKNKDSGKITVETAQKLADYHQQMADDYAKKQATHAQLAQAIKPAVIPKP